MKIPKYSIILSEKIKDTIGVSIEDGRYAGVFVNIRNSQLSHTNEVSVDYYIVDKPKHIIEEDFEDLHICLGLIFGDLLKDDE